MVTGAQQGVRARLSYVVLTYHDYLSAVVFTERIICHSMFAEMGTRPTMVATVTL
jgi:hypothetical protein